MGGFTKVKLAIAISAIGMLGASAGGFRAVDAASVIAGNVDYVNGGITQDEADRMRAEARDYPLEVVLARHRAEEGNEFLADTPVRIFDQAGQDVLDVPNAGPILLASLPDGRYTVVAEHDGKVKRQTIEIRGGRHEKVGFLW